MVWFSSVNTDGNNNNINRNANLRKQKKRRNVHRRKYGEFVELSKINHFISSEVPCYPVNADFQFSPVPAKQSCLSREKKKEFQEKGSVQLKPCMLENDTVLSNELHETIMATYSLSSTGELG